MLFTKHGGIIDLSISEEDMVFTGCVAGLTIAAVAEVEEDATEGEDMADAVDCCLV